MKIGPYTIEKYDDRNIIVTKRIQRTANRDTKNHNKGDRYWDDSFMGYHKNLHGALFAAYDDAIGNLLNQDYCEIDDLLFRMDDHQEDIINAVKGAQGLDIDIHERYGMDKLRKSDERYNKVRMLTTAGFEHIQKENMRTGKTFDMLIDEL